MPHKPQKKDLIKVLLPELFNLNCFTIFNPLHYCNFMQKIKKLYPLIFHKTRKTSFWVHFDPLQAENPKKISKKSVSDNFEPLKEMPIRDSGLLKFLVESG